MPSGPLERRLEQNVAAEPGLAETIRESGVEYVYYQFVTLNGRVMAKVAPAQHLARNLERGVQFHGSAVADLATSRHGGLIASGPEREEFLAMPDAGTFAVLPWDTAFGRFFCDLYARRDRADAPGEPLATCVRGNLERVHARFWERSGLELRSGTEPEMSWLGDDVEVWSRPNVSPAPFPLVPTSRLHLKFWRLASDDHQRIAQAFPVVGNRTVSRTGPMADLTEFATGITLVRGPGSNLAIRLETHDGRAVTLTLGAAERVALACELLAEARLRVGRAIGRRIRLAGRLWGARPPGCSGSP